MHNVRADVDKNRIYITVGKIKDEAEMQSFVDKAKSECQKLTDGFTCLTDLRGYEYQDEIFEKYIKEIQEFFLARNLSKVVRVHRWSGLLGHMQFDYLSLDLGYSGKNVTSIEEAEKILDGEE